MSKTKSWESRTNHFCSRLNLKIPILLAPMAGACPVGLSSAVANQGGLGACGALLLQPDAITEWAAAFRQKSTGSFQMNNWIPDPPPIRDVINEEKVRKFIVNWWPEANFQNPPLNPPDFEAQFEAMLAATPNAISSIMGIFPDPMIDRMKEAGICWLATATTVNEAILAEKSGADAIVAQGFEAGGHRGTFTAEQASAVSAGLFSLLPAIVDAVNIPVVAAGGIADSRGIAAALLLGASAVQIGTGFLRTPEAAIPSAWADAIGSTFPDKTILTRAFTGRLGRSIATDYAVSAEMPDALEPAPYPVQRQLTSGMTAQARQTNDLSRIQAWAGQSGHLASELPAGELTRKLWESARQLLA